MLNNDAKELRLLVHEDVCCAGEESIHISPRTGLVMEVSYLCGFIITEAAIVQWILRFREMNTEISSLGFLTKFLVLAS